MGQLILNVDDSEPQRYLRTRILRSAGFEVVEARSGQEALALVRERHPALVVLDVHLPDIDGRQVCRQIKADPLTSDVLVLHVSTVFGDSASRTEALNAGADAYLTDTIAPDEFVAHARALLRLSAAEASARHAEQALRQSEERLRLAQRAGGIGVYDFDVLTGAAVWSAELEAIYGRPAPADSTKCHGAWLDLLHPDDRERILKTSTEWLASPAPEADWEYRIVRPDGEHRCIAGRSLALRDSAGHAYRVIGTNTDITQRKDLERQLDLQRAQLEAVYQAMTDGVTVFDLTGKVLMANDAAARVCGYVRSEAKLRGMDARAVPIELRELDGTPVPFEAWPISRALRGEDVIGWTLCAKRTDSGEEWIFTFNAQQVRDEDGHPSLAVVVARDVTAEQRALESLRESEETARRRAEELGKLMDMVPAAIWVSEDPQCRVIVGNRAANSFYEAAPGENVSAGSSSGAGYDQTRRFFRDGIELRPEKLPMQHAAATGEEVRDSEIEVRTPSGRVVTILGSAIPLRTADGEVRGCIAGFINITERKRAEEALNRAHLELEEAARRKDEFLSMLSHELRNPLAPIRYAVPLLEKQPLDENAQRAVAVIKRQADQLTRLVDDLLDVSRIAKGKIELRREYVTLGTVLRAAAESASPRIVAKRHTLSLRVPDEPLWIFGDQARLAQIVTNLLDNSAKYTPDGGEIVLEAMANDGEAVIAVRDNGIGIPRDAIGSLFDMYVQVAGTGGGLGIGLAVVKRLVEMHGGTVEARSDGPARGSEFVVRLPLAQEGTSPSGDGKAEGRAPGGRIRVLVVDDNADLVEMLGMVIEAAGHEVRKAFDGRSALSAAASFRPHVVLLDLGLPGMSGIEVAAEMRKLPDFAGVRLVALTGWGQAEDRRRTRDAGFDHHLTKPTDPQELEELLASVAVGA